MQLINTKFNFKKIYPKLCAFDFDKTEIKIKDPLKLN